LFNGTLDYKPNVDAIERIIDSINPALMAKTGFTYKIIICGKSLPASFNGLQHQLQNNIIYAGFVDDINIYFYGADIFINPVTDGGGIKTKLIEALTADLCCITTRSGATGVPSVVTGKKMLVTEDDDWKSFADAIFAADISAHIPAVFFEHFYWGNIAAKAATIID
jgi:glycosyltransferase involved in cell wall biosynthesis